LKKHKISTKTSFILKKLCNSINDDASSFSSRLIDSCDSLKANLIPRIDILIKEKRDARRRLDKEKSRLINDLKRLRDNVESCKSQYNQQLNLILQYKKEYREKCKSLTYFSYYTI
jgi:predicted nuclease with TOPRIM domain